MLSGHQCGRAWSSALQEKQCTQACPWLKVCSLPQGRAECRGRGAGEAVPCVVALRAGGQGHPVPRGGRQVGGADTGGGASACWALF